MVREPNEVLNHHRNLTGGPLISSNKHRSVDETIIITLCARIVVGVRGWRCVVRSLSVMLVNTCTYCSLITTVMVVGCMNILSYIRD